MTGTGETGKSGTGTSGTGTGGTRWGGSGSGESVGSLADEAAKLMAAVQEWAAHNVGDGAKAHIATGAPECSWCPVCQLITVLRGDRPEVNEKLAEAAAAAMEALRALLNTTTARAPDQRPVQRVSFGD